MYGPECIFKRFQQKECPDLQQPKKRWYDPYIEEEEEEKDSGEPNLPEQIAEKCDNVCANMISTKRESFDEKTRPKPLAEITTSNQSTKSCITASSMSIQRPRSISISSSSSTASSSSYTSTDCQEDDDPFG
jgi:hypothetical protein